MILTSAQNRGNADARNTRWSHTRIHVTKEAVQPEEKRASVPDPTPQTESHGLHVTAEHEDEAGPDCGVLETRDSRQISEA